jgi:hypothetical protein
MATAAPTTNLNRSADAQLRAKACMIVEARRAQANLIRENKMSCKALMRIQKKIDVEKMV